MTEYNLQETCLLKTIPLFPTEFCVDVWVCDNEDILSREFNKRYGASYEYYKEQYFPNQVMSISSTENSELKGDRTIAMVVDSWDDGCKVHEIYHVVAHLHGYTKVGITAECQEWVACMMEYLFNRCKNDGSFTIRK